MADRKCGGDAGNGEDDEDGNEDVQTMTTAIESRTMPLTLLRCIAMMMMKTQR